MHCFIYSSSFYPENLSESGDRYSGWIVSISHKHNKQAPGNENTHFCKIWLSKLMGCCIFFLFFFFCARWKSLIVLISCFLICNRPSLFFFNAPNMHEIWKHACTFWKSWFIWIYISVSGKEKKNIDAVWDDGWWTDCVCVCVFGGVVAG